MHRTANLPIHNRQFYVFVLILQGSLGDVEMKGIWREEEKEETSLFPYRPYASHQFASVVKYNECLFADGHREFVKGICYKFGSDGICCGESVIVTFVIQPSRKCWASSLFGRECGHPPKKLPSVWHIFPDADMVLISEIQICKPSIILDYKLLQLSVFIFIELRWEASLEFFIRLAPKLIKKIWTYSCKPPYR